MRKSAIALIVATLSCGTASAYLWQELRAEREQARVLEARVAELEEAQARSSPQMEPRAFEELPSSPTEPTIAATPPAKSPPAATFTAVPQAALAFAGPRVRDMRMDPEMRQRVQANFEQQQNMLKDPEYRELMRSQQKLGMKRMYGDMETMLGLSKDEAERVLDVLAEHQLRSMEQRPIMPVMDGSQPDEATIREQQRVFEETKRKNDAEIAAALGPKYSEWQGYQQSMWSRSQVMRLRETLAGTEEPLRQDQVKPLVQALAREQQQMQTNTMRSQIPPGGRMTQETQLRMQEEWLERTAQSHERIRNSVSSLLTPSQLQQLQEQQDQERKMQELNLRMQRARAAEAAARGEDLMTEGPAGISSNSMILR
jgi:hypothetical protein